MGEAADTAARVAASPDGELVRRAAEGSGEAFDSLVLRYQDRVYGLALRLTRRPEEAEDVAQEAFLKAYRALPSFRGRSAFYTWLFRITFNAAHSRLRSLGRLRARETASPTEPDPASSVETSDSAERVRRAVDALDEANRAVVVLREIEGLSYEEIAEVTGASRAAVKSRLHRARTELAGTLKDLVQ